MINTYLILYQPSASGAPLLRPSFLVNVLPPIKLSGPISRAATTKSVISQRPLLDTFLNCSHAIENCLDDTAACWPEWWTFTYLRSEYQENNAKNIRLEIIPATLRTFNCDIRTFTYSATEAYIPNLLLLTSVYKIPFSHPAVNFMRNVSWLPWLQVKVCIFIYIFHIWSLLFLPILSRLRCKFQPSKTIFIM